jgi:hypothetical protein
MKNRIKTHSHQIDGINTNLKEENQMKIATTKGSNSIEELHGEQSSDEIGIRTKVYTMLLNILTITDSGREKLNQIGISNDTIDEFGIKWIDRKSMELNRFFCRLFDEKKTNFGLFTPILKKSNLYLTFVEDNSIIIPIFENNKPVYFIKKILSNKTGKLVDSYGLYNMSKSMFVGKFSTDEEVIVFDEVIESLRYHSNTHKKNFIALNGNNSTDSLMNFPKNNLIYAEII